MISPAEAQYRDTLNEEPQCIQDALESVLPADASDDDPATALTRKLCFEPAQHGRNTTVAFASKYPFMMNHGARQVALALEVMRDPSIEASLPDWFDIRTFCLGVIAADVGLVFVPEDEVERVHSHGPRYVEYYTAHPGYGYGMALAVDPLDVAETQQLAAFIGRHHRVQARNQYGPSWRRLKSDLIAPPEIDRVVALQKPFDFIDDTLDRVPRADMPPRTYEQQVEDVVARFTGSFGELLCGNLGFSANTLASSCDTALPIKLAKSIRAQLLDTTDIGNIYRNVVTETAMT